MKKRRIISLIVTLCLCFAIAIPVSASGVSDDMYDAISERYGIPLDVVRSLNEEMLLELYEDVENNRLVGSEQSYIKITETDDGSVTMQESSFEQYLSEIATQASNEEQDEDESSGWMRLVTTVSEVDYNTGEAACAFTWLTSPSPRFKDVVGVSLRQGTMDMNTATGFYAHSSPDVSGYIYEFQPADINERGAGATARFKLKITDYISGVSDTAFLKIRFTKEGNSEGVNGTYAHQTISLVINPSFSIDRNGVITPSGLEFLQHYKQASGYVSINW